MPIKDSYKTPVTAAQGSSGVHAAANQAARGNQNGSAGRLRSDLPTNNGSGRRQQNRADTSDFSREARSPENSEGGFSDLLNGMAGWAAPPSGESPATPNQQQSEAPPRLELEQGQLLSAGRGNAEQVTRLQEMLNAGGGGLEVDGVFGPRTAEAVRNFQRQNGLTVDGIVGPQTLAALNGGGGASRQSEGAATDGAGTNGDASTDRTSGSTGQSETAPDNSAAGSTTRLQGIPERSEDARGGRAFMESIAHLPPGRQRDQAILNEIMSGNIPDASRNLQELVINRDGREIRLNAMPDYLAIGSNEDYIRVPMTPAVAQAIADRTGTSLPTDRLVDDIYSQSRRLHMAPMSNNREGISTYIAHDQRIDDQLGSGTAPGEFVSGHKKDLVIPHRDGRVAIYGGRWQNGDRIQSYSNVHHAGYEDYSHGARLISQQIMIDGRSMRLEDALADPSLRSLFTNQSGSFRY